MTHEPHGLRLDAADALMLQFESPDTAFHTLKIAILDPSDRGRAVTLADLVEWVPRYLDITPRLTQRVVRRSYWRWYWADDAAFNVTAHLEERTVAGPDGLDRLCGELATRQLDRSRPLWAITLVNGLPEGKQAAVVRIHHAVMDGSAAMNAFVAVTSPDRDTAPAVPVRTVPAPARRPAFPRRLMTLVAAGVRVVRRTREFGPSQDVPRSFLKRTRFNPRSGVARVCGSRPVAVADLEELAGFLDSNVNGAVHATLALAFREYMIAAGDPPKHPLVLNYGVAEDPGSTRCEGNKLATARLWLQVDDPDPVSLAVRTARSTTESVALRRHRGFEFQRHATELAWIMPAFRRWFVDLPPFTPVHVLSAYVSGPTTARWLGDVAATGFLSYAISVAPTDLSITAYRYAGQLWMGVVVTPEAMPDPANFLTFFDKALSDLLALASDPSQVP
jgi:diacylglycerol O-acyltransferase